VGTDGATTTVMVVDDHPIWRDAVARDLAAAGFAVVATADGVGAARRRAAVVKPDVVLMDMRLADGDGAQATTEVLTVSPSSRVLVLSASDERDDVLEAVKAGATGYLVKSASKTELADAVRATADGRAVFTPGLAGLVLGEYRRIAQRPGAGPPTPSLTERETEVLRYVAKGLSAKQIAAKLSLSHRTVENHVQATFRKLQLANRVELTRYAFEHGLDE
jgi:DNA-binding NarL/FixJ family response regulator